MNDAGAAARLRGRGGTPRADGRGRSPPATSSTTSSSTRRSGSSTLLRGGTVDPSSGKPITPSNPCGAASEAEVARMNADVAARRYTGLARLRRLARRRADRALRRLLGPEPPAAGGHAARRLRRLAALPRPVRPRPAAVRPPRASTCPTYIARGNHDGLLEGVAAGVERHRPAARDELREGLPRRRDRPGHAARRPAHLLPLLQDPQTIQNLLADAQRVPPDPDRRVIDRAEYKRVMGGSIGLRHVERARRTARSGGTASYYAFAPRKGLRFIAIDTVAEGGDSNGNVDHPQYEWLRARAAQGEAAQRADVVFGHHTLATMVSDGARRARGRLRRPGLRRGPARARRRCTSASAATRATCATSSSSHRTSIAYVAGPHARQHRHPVPPRQARVLGDLDGLAHRLAAAEPHDRAVRQRRRDALAVRDDHRPPRPRRGAAAGPGRRTSRSSSSRRWRARSRGTTRSARRGRRPASPASTGAANRATATSSC